MICSRTEKLNSNLNENISETIGCEYNLVVIDNSSNRFSIFEAYNRGIQESNSEIICFVHDDIRFRTMGWGNEIQRIFQINPSIGLLGVAGGRYKSKMPSAWWEAPKEYNVINIIQHTRANKKIRINKGFEKSDLVEVVAIDGVFMAMRRNRSIKFNQNLKGFHNYDLQISLHHQLLKKKVAVTNTILLEHFSQGYLNKDWAGTLIQANKLYKKILPLNKGKELNREEEDRIEFKNGTILIKVLLESRMYGPALKFWLKIMFLKPKLAKHVPLIKYWFTILKKDLLN